jgi:hypothetical protein
VMLADQHLWRRLQPRIPVFIRDFYHSIQVGTIVPTSAIFHKQYQT